MALYAILFYVSRHCFVNRLQKIKLAYEGIKKNGKEVFIGVNTRNQRMYMMGVRNQKGEWIGFFERFELNLAK